MGRTKGGAARIVAVIEDMEKLNHCIGQLNERHRDYVEKRYKDGLSVKKIAEMAEQPANTIAQVMHRARMALINCIKTQRFET